MSKPPSEREKEAFVESVFSSIVSRYDFLNAVMSLGRDSAWRKLAVSLMGLGTGDRALDVCCGTGDLAFEMGRVVGESGRVVGADFSLRMLQEAARKSEGHSRGQVAWCAAEADCLPFANAVFDGAAVAFGLRNVPDSVAAISEMTRVVRPGGRVVSLEILDIRAGFAALPWRLYFHRIAPRVAGMLGGRRTAYEYLSRSVAGFVSAEDLADQFRKCGLRDVTARPLALGGVYIHVGTK